jgi:diguanylate cyclase (GGDEF)-like protein
MVHAISVVETGVVLTRPERFAVTAEIVFAITSSRVLDEVLANVARRTAEALDVWECDIYDYRPAENCTVGLALWSREPHPADADWVGSTQDLADQPVFRRVLSEGRMAASHIDDPELPVEDREGMEWWGEKSCLLVPLVFEDEVIGCLELVEKRHLRRFTEQECELASTLAALAAVAIENARLHSGLELLATTDGLTGLYNQRYFNERLAQEVARAHRYGLPLSLLMIDVDDFKLYNDHFGHRAGDALLRGLGALLARHTRQQIDLAARYGGDEFAIVLPSTGAAEAAKAGERLRDVTIVRGIATAVAAETQAPPPVEADEAALKDGDTGAARAAGERIRAGVENESFGSGQRPPIVTVSIGVATLPDHAATPDGLVEQADHALYRAKEQGKNRVETASTASETAS